MDNTPNNLKQTYEEQLRKELLDLANYKKALEEEFEGKLLEDPETAKLAKNTVLELVPQSASVMKWLLVHAESESIRKDIAKWVLDLAMKAHEKAQGDDVMTQLLKELNSPITHSPNSE